MNLAAYFKTAPRGKAAAVAAELRVSPVMVSQWATGTKPVPTARCAAIVKATKGAVQYWHLRPDDWHRIWPMLVGTPGAPAPQRELPLAEPEAA